MTCGHVIWPLSHHTYKKNTKKPKKNPLKLSTNEKSGCAKCSFSTFLFSLLCVVSFSILCSASDNTLPGVIFALLLVKKLLISTCTFQWMAFHSLHLHSFCILASTSLPTGTVSIVFAMHALVWRSTHFAGHYLRNLFSHLLNQILVVQCFSASCQKTTINNSCKFLVMWLLFGQCFLPEFTHLFHH